MDLCCHRKLLPDCGEGKRTLSSLPFSGVLVFTSFWMLFLSHSSSLQDEWYAPPSYPIEDEHCLGLLAVAMALFHPHSPPSLGRLPSIIPPSSFTPLGSTLCLCLHCLLSCEWQHLGLLENRKEKNTLFIHSCSHSFIHSSIVNVQCCVSGAQYKAPTILYISQHSSR